MSEGTYAQLMQVAGEKPPRSKQARPAPGMPEAEPKPAKVSTENLDTTPYISQNYRFTEDELRWLRRQAYNLTERLGTKVSQNTILRVALHFLRDSTGKSPRQNPLLEAVTKLKK